MNSNKPAIPEIEDYSTQQLEQASTWSVALKRYLEWKDIQPPSEEEALRLLRHHYWCRCALAVYFQNESPENICHQWSVWTDEIVGKAWQICRGDEAGLALLALGKWGSCELNLSSDIDLVLIRPDGVSTEPRFLSQFQRLLGQHTRYGFCYRLDFDLRPGGRLGSYVPSISEFIDYFSNYGEAWERTAYMRGRFVVGSDSIEQEVNSFLSRFIYRRHLDYTLLDDLKDMRKKIQRVPPANPGAIHLKLVAGGIRDIELFAHSLLLIHGGKDPQIRTSHTSQAFENLQNKGSLPKDVAQFLFETYWQLRDLENFVQAQTDQQTYIIEESRHKEPLAERANNLLRQRLKESDRLISEFLGPAMSESKIPTTSDQQRAWLAELGFSKKSIDDVWSDLKSLSALSKNRQRDEVARQDFLYQFVTELAVVAVDKDLGLSLLHDFLKATRAKATFFRLFNQYPALVHELAWLFSASPFLGQMLCSSPEILDGFVLKTHPEPPADLESLLNYLSERKNLHYLVAASQFISQKQIELLTDSLTSNADFTAQILLDQLYQRFRESEIDILCLGKWGGRELGFKSDLDFIFVSNNKPREEDFRLAKRFVSYISSLQSGGRLYSVDLRLRPSGAAGPLMMKKQSLIDFLTQNAEPWRRQAYLRARYLSEEDPTPIYEASLSSGLTGPQLQELHSIRQKLYKKGRGPMDLKYTPGGLISIEFALQTSLLQKQLVPKSPSTLDMLQTLADNCDDWKAVAPRLNAIYRQLRTFEQLYHLTRALASSDTHLQKDSHAFERLAIITGHTREELAERLSQWLKESRGLLEDLDPIIPMGT